MLRLKSRTAALAALAVLAAAAASGPAVAASCPMIEVAAVAPHGEAGARVFGRTDGGTVAVSSPPLVSARDIVDAKVSSAEGETGLGMRMSAEAAERIHAYTAAHTGGSLAFIVDGRAQMVMKIVDPVAGDGFWISPVEPTAAKQLASALHDCARDPGRCPPGTGAARVTARCTP